MSARFASDAASLRDTAIALAVTLAIQIFTSLASTATPVLAPDIGRDLGVAPRLVGVFVGLVYIGSMIASLAAGQFIHRHGAIRVSQVAVLICSVGIAIVASASSTAIVLLALAPVVIGLGYGPITPASSHVLARTTPPSRMALTFSIKQTGVPAGAAIAGALLPTLAGALGWRAAFIALSVTGVVIAIASQPSRRQLDGEVATTARPFSLRELLSPLRVLVSHHRLRELSITGFVYAATQMCLMSFLVVYLTESLQLSLVAAGLALTTANLGGIVGRIVWGAIADHLGAPRLMLAIIGLIAGACSLLAAAFDAGGSAWLRLAVCALFGATAIGWNGVQLSEIARQAPEGQAGPITGASGFITFSGVVLGPPTFALLASMSGSYRVGFAVFGTLNLLCGIALLWRRSRRAASATR
ncbi:MAG TPA: MFS transporter [Casimicrobiaceae bacterium]|nr:MFS transporter [Casimicrobiaceae bacterium]